MERALRFQSALYVLLDYLGIPHPTDKHFGPATRAVVLGLIVGNTDMTIAIPEDKRQKLVSLLSHWQTKSATTVRDLMSLVGKLYLGLYGNDEPGYNA